jgi:hypothetical protein
MAQGGRAVPRPGREARRGGGRAAAAWVGAPVGRPGARREQRDARGQRERRVRERSERERGEGERAVSGGGWVFPGARAP